MKKLTLLTTAVVMAFSVEAMANHGKHKQHKKHHYDKHSYHQKGHRKHHGNHFYDFARVSSVNPIYETVEHRVPQSCNHSSHYDHHKSQSATPVILGGVIGGAIGNRVGSNKSNKKVGAVVGSILGASIASDLNRHDRHISHRCKNRYTTRFEQQLVGYDVLYNYRGNTYRTTMQDHPGNRVQLRLSFDPVKF